jgi:hypothetical protein
MTNLIPEYLTKNELLAILHELTVLVSNDDSFGGFVQYDAMDEDIPEGKDFGVVASYRHGNLLGQGGVTIIGTVPGAATSESQSG